MGHDGKPYGVPQDDGIAMWVADMDFRPHLRSNAYPTWPKLAFTGTMEMMRPIEMRSAGGCRNATVERRPQLDFHNTWFGERNGHVR